MKTFFYTCATVNFGLAAVNAYFWPAPLNVAVSVFCVLSGFGQLACVIALRD